MILAGQVGRDRSSAPSATAPGSRPRRRDRRCARRGRRTAASRPVPTGSCCGPRRRCTGWRRSPSELETLVARAEDTMPRRTLARDASVTGIGLHTGAHHHGDLPAGRRRAAGSCSGALDLPGAPGDSRPARRGRGDRAPHRAGQGRAHDPHGRAPARRGRGPADRRPRRRGGRARAADRRRVVPAVRSTLLRRPGSPSQPGEPGGLPGHRAVQRHRGRRELRRRSGARRSASPRPSSGTIR